MKAAIVTGANKGVGFGIVETLARSLDTNTWRVYLTSRNVDLGRTAVKQLHDKGLTNVVFHQLDICDSASIDALVADMRLAHPEGVNILVNNAAINAHGHSSTATTFAEKAKITMKTNFFATLEVCRKMTPLLAKDARVVNLTGEKGRISLSKCRPDVQKRLMTPMSMPEIEALMAEFLQAAEDDTIEVKGWMDGTYSISKIGITIMSAALAHELRNDTRGILVNACCPGLVRTDLSSQKGQKTILEGADTPAYLALLPPGTKEPNGKYVRDRVILPLEPVADYVA